jgi:Ca2+-binding EF-hand superfamily protein
MSMLRQRTTVRMAVRPIYRAMDEDHRGGVTHEEFIDHMRRLGLEEPDHVLKWVAEAIDQAGEDMVTYAAFGKALSPGEMEDGLLKPELKVALEVAQGRRPQPSRAALDYPPRPPPAFPIAPQSLKGGAALLSSKYAWSEWGGVPLPADAGVAAAAAAAAAAGGGTDGGTDGKSAGALRPGGPLRVQERAEARARHKVQSVLDALRQQIEIHGSIAKAFRRLETTKDSKIDPAELQGYLRKQLHIDMSDETSRDVIKELDANGDGEIEYSEFVRRLLGKFDIDTTGDRNGAHGGGGQHVAMDSQSAGQRAAAAQRARGGVGALNAMQRHDAAIAMETIRQRLLTKHANLRDAFRAIDVDSDNTLSYDEFGQLILQWMPELEPGKCDDVCRLLDADGDGMIDFDEFSSVLAASGNNLKHSTGALLREREQKAVSNMMNARKGRFGATPASSYGIQIRELIASYPGTTHYMDDAARFGPSVAAQQVPEWQLTDAAKKAQAALVRREQMRYHTQRQEAVAGARQRVFEQRHDSNINSLVAQRARYTQAVAVQNVSYLKNQATFRSAHSRTNQMCEQMNPLSAD